MNLIGKSCSDWEVYFFQNVYVRHCCFSCIHSIKAELESRSSGKDDAGPLMKMKDR
jgi:hypothetical protein